MGFTGAILGRLFKGYDLRSTTLKHLNSGRIRAKVWWSCRAWESGSKLLSYLEVQAKTLGFRV